MIGERFNEMARHAKSLAGAHNDLAEGFFKAGDDRRANVHRECARQYEAAAASFRAHVWREGQTLDLETEIALGATHA